MSAVLQQAQGRGRLSEVHPPDEARQGSLLDAAALQVRSLPLVLRIGLVGAMAAGLAIASLAPSLAPPSAHRADLGFHMAAYMAAPVFAVVLFGHLRTWVAAVWIYACTLEGLQHWVPGRTASWDDALANTLGVGLGLAVVLAVRRCLRQRRVSLTRKRP